MFYIFIITLLVLTLVVTESLALNVRTTLFTSADLGKKRWNKREVALLRARMYFQGMVPPIGVTENPDYLSSLIRYIENCYAAINQAAFDQETGTILTVAASDVIGGYLKMVALPVTKYAYYNGDIPTKDALKLFKYYEDIKNQLHTTGKGWSEALKNIVKPQNVRDVRSDSLMPKIKRPCERLLYLKNSRQNVTMPLPSIDWKTRMMFVPLTNQPIVHLKSPEISSVLQRFHQVASACERSIDPGRKIFQGTFEEWVRDAVVPHLSDDDLYTAFKGILTLIDNNSNIEPQSPQCKTHQGYFKNIFHNMSKKTIVIIIILALEIICCIPTLVYCLLKNKKGSCSKLISSRSPSELKKDFTNKTVFYELSSSRSSSRSDNKINSRVNSNSYKNFIKKKTASDPSIGSTTSMSRRSYSSITDAVTTADEAPSIKKSSHQRILSASQHSLRFKLTETEKIDVTQGQTQVSKQALLPRKSSSSTAKNTSNDTGETVTLSSVLPQDKSTKVIRKSKRFRPRHIVEPVEPLGPDSFSPYPSLDGRVSHDSNLSKTVKELTLEMFDDRLVDIPLSRYNSDKTVEFASPRPSRTRTKNSEMSVTRSIKFDNDSVERMDRTWRVSENVSRQTLLKEEMMPPNRKGILKTGEEGTRMRKVSKIPKKVNSPRAYCECSSPRLKKREPAGWKKSLIPKLERALDDSALSSGSPRNGKLNVTL